MRTMLTAIRALRLFAADDDVEAPRSPPGAPSKAARPDKLDLGDPLPFNLDEALESGALFAMCCLSVECLSGESSPDCFNLCVQMLRMKMPTEATKALSWMDAAFTVDRRSRRQGRRCPPLTRGERQSFCRARTEGHHARTAAQLAMRELRYPPLLAITPNPSGKLREVL